MGRAERSTKPATGANPGGVIEPRQLKLTITTNQGRPSFLPFGNMAMLKEPGFNAWM
jgi:hypothetical protein